MWWETSFKKRKSGKLKWINVQAETWQEALKKCRLDIARLYPRAGYVVYGGPLEYKSAK